MIADPVSSRLGGVDQVGKLWLIPAVGPEQGAVRTVHRPACGPSRVFRGRTREDGLAPPRQHPRILNALSLRFCFGYDGDAQRWH